MAEVKIVWDPEAKESFKKFLKHIRTDSLQAAEKMRADVLMIVESIPKNPHKFPPDKFKEKNDGSFRAFEKHNCRITYSIVGSQIWILRVRHVKQEPKSH